MSIQELALKVGVSEQDLREVAIEEFAKIPNNHQEYIIAAYLARFEENSKNLDWDPLTSDCSQK